MKKLTVLLIFSLLVGWQPSFAQDTKDQALSDDSSSKAVQSALMMTCYVCHNPRVKSHDDIIAPPLVAVKYMYKNKYPEKEDFVKNMMGFVLEPTNQKAVMQGPVMRFGVMPEMPLDKDQVELIVNYIYDNPIEEPSWFAEHFRERHGIEWKGQ